MVLCSGDLDWYDRSGVLAFEERVDRFQKNGFYSRSGLRKLSLQFEESEKIELLFVQAIRAVQRHQRSWDLEVEVGKLHVSILE